MVRFDPYRLLRPLLFALEPETAHRLALMALASGLALPLARRPEPRAGAGRDGILAQRIWGLDFPNPLGLAAGFDKNGRVFRSALGLGFGFVELGSVTPRPQSGNPRPRLFRSAKDSAIINRMGFNNAGLASVRERLRRRDRQRGIVGANLGKNKETEDAAADYEAGVRALAPLADYLVINVSSPNTPGLRALQGRAPLAELIGRALDARAGIAGRRPPLLLKIAPDLTEEDKSDIAEVALAADLDGLIVSNTTIARPLALDPRFAAETGGLSGRPLFAPSTALLADMYRLTRGRLPIIGVGGIFSAEDAYAKIRAGASLVQLYTSLVFEGPSLVGRILDQLARRVADDGFSALGQAVGADHRPEIRRSDMNRPLS